MGAPSTQHSTPRKEVLEPTAEVLRLLRSEADPEKHVSGFAAWHAWRTALPSEQKRAANRFLAQERWLDVLGDEVLYDMVGPKRRLSAYKLLRRIGGQRVFPYFLWGIGDTKLRPDPLLGLGRFLKRMVSQSAYVQWFFRRHGDPTVIEFLPVDYKWQVVREKIEQRWAGRNAPRRQWSPLQTEAFVKDLTREEPALRRLAIRALTTNERSGGIAAEGRYRPLLADADPSVRLVAAEALTITACPAARGSLKRMVEDAGASLELRRTCLFAVVHCRKARRWTAEWMIDNLPTWPEALDETVQASLVRLCPSHKEDWRPYPKFLKGRLERSANQRVRRTINGALAALPQ